MVVHRFEVSLVSLEPTVGGESQKNRPCLLISPDAMLGRITLPTQRTVLATLQGLFAL